MFILQEKKNGQNNARKKDGLNIKNEFVDWKFWQWLHWFGESGITSQNFSFAI